MHSEETAEITHPGPILRAARDELRLSIEEVADQLHLRPSVVTQIESESYHDFSNDVFLRGYFRSYCRLVGLHEERMVELLDKQLLAIQKEMRQSEREHAEEKARLKRNHALKLASVAVSILVICVFVIWTLIGADLERAESSGQNLGNAEEEQTDAQGALGQISTAALSDDEQLAGGNDQTLVIEDQKLPASELLASNGVDSRSSVNVNSLDNTISSSNVSERPESSGGAENSGENTDRNEVDIAIRFSGDCWFEVYDAQGQRVLADLKREADSFVYSSVSPLRLIFGDGNVAELSVNGKAYDFSSRIRRSGRAEVIID